MSSSWMQPILFSRRFLESYGVLQGFLQRLLPEENDSMYWELSMRSAMR